LGRLIEYVVPGWQCWCV